MMLKPWKNFAYSEESFPNFRPLSALRREDNHYNVENRERPTNVTEIGSLNNPKTEVSRYFNVTGDSGWIPAQVEG